MEPLHKRIVIKLSGEFLQETTQDTFSPQAVDRVVRVLSLLIENKIELGIVIGAGNLFRGKESSSLMLDRVVGDQIGMLGTIMNALVVCNALRAIGIRAHVMAPNPSVSSVLPYDAVQAKQLIQKGEPVFIAGATGNPFFTTDSAATLRALELDATVLVKSTKVKGVFSSDPVKDKGATRFEEISFEEVLKRRLEVMDHTAIAMAMQYGLPIFIYKFGDPMSVLEAMNSADSGTYVFSKQSSNE